jgi:hypothetical protein
MYISLAHQQSNGSPPLNIFEKYFVVLKATLGAMFFYRNTYQAPEPQTICRKTTLHIRMT